MRWSLFLGLCLLVAGCLGGDAEPESADSGLSADASPADCIVPGTDPSWLRSMQDDVLRKLTGVEPVADGVVLSDRATAGRRAATREFLVDTLTALGYERMLHDYGTGINIMAGLDATVDGAETIVIGAHFDSVPGSPGANDNATGVAMVLAAARYAHELTCRSKALAFVLFDEEEVGLIGSQHFAQMLLDSTELGVMVEAVHTIDQNGWDGDGDRAFEIERPDVGLLDWYLDARDAAGKSMPIHQTNTGSTDHVSFREQGFAAAGVTEEYVNGDTTPHYHLPGDTYETVDREYLASTTQVLLTMLREKVASESATQRAAGEASDLRASFEVAAERPIRPVLAREPGCRARMSDPSAPR